MKRKVIQIANSTQLISLPRKWCLQNNVKKGDELSVDFEGPKVFISCKQDSIVEHSELRIKDYGVLTPRAVYALYRKGVDEVRINFEKPEDAQVVQNALRNETVGYEIVEQDTKCCTIKNISSNIMGFDTMLRRTFLLLISMAEECAKALSRKDIPSLKNLLALEESNNRFTALCRRYLNKYGPPGNQKSGPLYRIIEELENIADEYKYLINTLLKMDEQEIKITRPMVRRYEMNAQTIRDYYDAFYKFDPQKMTSIGDFRKQLVEEWNSTLNQLKSPSEIVLMHHSLVILQKVFNIIGPLFILQIPTTE